MKNRRNKKLSIINLIAGYLCALLFFFLIAVNIKDENLEAAENSDKILTLDLAVAEKNNTVFDGITPDKVYTNNTSLKIIEPYPKIIREPNVIMEQNKQINRAGSVIYGYTPNRDLLIDETFIDKKHTGNSLGYTESRIGINGVFMDNRYVNEGASRHGKHNFNLRESDGDADIGILDRRLAQLDKNSENIKGRFVKNRLNQYNKTGIDKNNNGIDLSKMTLARDDAELGDIDLDFKKNNSKGYGVGKGGELYAYNYPSQGVGAGIGSSAIGAGAGGGAGLGAGIGEGILNGEAVPTLGGIGTGPEPLEGQPSGVIPSGGVGGLIGGAGAGGAAGLTQGYIIDKLGMGLGSEQGSGGGYNYDHLPKDGALHIMLHVDGSGSILNTRKNLDEMKNTLLKRALLPYYNNDEDLYNRRVTIVSSSGERTLRFFNEAVKKDNVLAIAFQDEAQPAYHLPNFNKKPEDHYLDDIQKLKASLDGYAGTYRGVMFQVDRGKTFAKSFKEFVGNAFKGEGYLESVNLKKYHRDANLSHIKNKNGIVFSDEYHAKDSGDPQYYLDLIFKASKRVGLDLDIYGAGLKDGKYTKN